MSVLHFCQRAAEIDATADVRANEARVAAVARGEDGDEAAAYVLAKMATDYGLHDVCAIVSRDTRRERCECWCHEEARFEEGRYCDRPFSTGQTIEQVFTSRQCRNPARYRAVLSGEVVVGGVPFRSRRVEYREGEKVVYSCGVHIGLDRAAVAKLDRGEAIEHGDRRFSIRYERNDPGWGYEVAGDG